MTASADISMIASAARSEGSAAAAIGAAVGSSTLSLSRSTTEYNARTRPERSAPFVRSLQKVVRQAARQTDDGEHGGTAQRLGKNTRIADVQSRKFRFQICGEHAADAYRGTGVRAAQRCSEDRVRRTAGLTQDAARYLLGLGKTLTIARCHTLADASSRIHFTTDLILQLDHHTESPVPAAPGKQVARTLDGHDDGVH